VPADLHVVDVGDHYVRLAWADTASQEPAVFVEGRLDGATDFTLLALLEPGSLDWEGAVQPESTHVFRVAARVDTSRSAWSPPVTVTALRLGYWEVVGGVKNDACQGLDVFFRFGRANRFYSGGGLLTVAGPLGWNDDQVFQSAWNTYYIGFNGRGAVSGDYHLTLARDDRTFAADVTLDASLVLPLPEVDLETLPDRRLRANWSCAGADRYGICWGPVGQAGCQAVGACTDTVLVALEDDPVYWFDLMAYRDPVQGQEASSSRLFSVSWEKGLTAEAKRRAPGGTTVDSE
jgi:hypothetical protein